MADVWPEMMALSERLQPSELDRSLDHLVLAVLFAVAVFVFYFIRDRNRKRHGHRRSPPPSESTMTDTPETEDQRIPDRVQKIIDAEKMRFSIGLWVIIIALVVCCGLVCYWLFF